MNNNIDKVPETILKIGRYKSYFTWNIEINESS